MARHISLSASVLAALVMTACAADQSRERTTSPPRKPPADIAGTASRSGTQIESHDTNVQSLMGQRVVLGTVEEVVSGQAKVDTGEVQPRFIPMKPR